jgi:hypothetical protein
MPMCPICRKKPKQTMVGAYVAGRREEVHPECYESLLVFVRAIEAVHAKVKKKQD